jgi:hypothetical protein
VNEKIKKEKKKKGKGGHPQERTQNQKLNKNGQKGIFGGLMSHCFLL